ncbi:hypothetical protein SO694_0006613 [Aureococcus anophagefferens]|uniref:Uncharacterized protein n=1 Tax=Aureococcus anophagefferens TaxID=44056 RepID=A0ABR1FQ72_AURAN
MAEELLLEPGFLSQTLRSAHETAAEAEACADEARAAALHERAAQGYVAAARRVTDGAAPRARGLSGDRARGACGPCGGRGASRPRSPTARGRRPRRTGGRARSRRRARSASATSSLGGACAHAWRARRAPDVRDAPRPATARRACGRRGAARRRLPRRDLGRGRDRVVAPARLDDDAGGAAAQTPASEAAALARAVERLAAANAALVAERDDLRRDNAESRAIKAEMVAFKALFQQKFDALRDRLEAFRRDYPSPANPANATRPGDPDPPKSAVDLEAENRQLRARLGAERDAGRKKDAIISRYEHWYRALKASANSKRRPSLTKESAAL